MIKMTTCCDMCGVELPHEPIQTPFGEMELVDNSKTTVWDVSLVFPHLCKSCALRIDKAMLNFREGRLNMEALDMAISALEKQGEKG